MLNRIFIFYLSIIIIATATDYYPQNKSTNQWKSLSFLLGEWVGEGSGSPGEATGEFSFTSELQNTILVRKSFANYPAQNGRPAVRHDDLMVVYNDGNSVKANYFDNEGHVINYNVNISQDSLSVIFISDPVLTSPRFQFTYTKIDDSKMKFSFDMASPGKPEDFTTYINGVVKRK